eukprot:UN06030
MYQGLLVCFVVLLGTIVFYYTEKHEWPGNNDGEDLTFDNTFHFSLVTMSTVGYGDWAPTSRVRQTFGAFFILIGVMLLANFASLVVNYLIERDELLQSQEFLNTST